MKSEGGMAKKRNILKVVLNKDIASLVESYILIGIYMKILICCFLLLQIYKKFLKKTNYRAKKKE